MGEVTRGLTPFQTAGPFLHLGLRAGLVASPTVANFATSAGQAAQFLEIDPTPLWKTGERVVVEGRLFDGAGVGLPDGALECWQAEASAFVRILTAGDGSFRLETVRTSHIAVVVLGRGILTCYWTRIYLEDTPHLEDDPVLALVPAERRQTLVARKAAAGVYHFDVWLQGPHETVFFDV
jgi:protocatechuate 3,4-dioxygenase, alpha subunit